MTLLEKLEAATEGSRELDIAIFEHFNLDCELRQFTTSIDAALALVRRKWPDSVWAIDSPYPNHPLARMLLWMRYMEDQYCGEGHTECLAIMIALVKAEGEK